LPMRLFAVVRKLDGCLFPDPDQTLEAGDCPGPFRSWGYSDLQIRSRIADTAIQRRRENGYRPSSLKTQNCVEKFALRFRRPRSHRSHPLRVRLNPSSVYIPNGPDDDNNRADLRHNALDFLFVPHFYRAHQRPSQRSRRSRLRKACVGCRAALRSAGFPGQSDASLNPSNKYKVQVSTSTSVRKVPGAGDRASRSPGPVKCVFDFVS
jgi:hypothetical protein